MQTDIHTKTAKKMFDTNNITPEMRLTAKRKNFLELYGSHNAPLNQQFQEFSKEEVEEFMRSFDTSEFEKRTMLMYDKACEIRDLADSEYASDAHLLEMSEKFKAEFGCNWTEILN